MDLRIDALASCPGFVPTVAGWIYAQWWTQVAGASPATLDARLRADLGRSPPPLTLVAAAGARALGTVSLLAHDVGTQRWAALSPWLAALYVVPEARRRGVGAALVEAAVTHAAHLPAAKLYLLTTEQQAFYARRGWQVLEKHGNAIAMMRVIAPA